MCRVKVIAYNCTVNADGKTRRLQKATEATGGAWKDVAQLSEAALAALVREDGVDILVELTGHTANNRLGVMAKQPAPVQVSGPSAELEITEIAPEGMHLLLFGVKAVQAVS